MDTLFVTILNMSITGSIVIAAVIFIRFFLKKLPKKYSYLLWSVVAFRLCVPVSFESIISIFQFKPLQAYSNNVIADSGVMSYVSMPETTVTSPQAVTPVQNTANVLDMTELQRSVAITDVLPYVWLAGVILFAVYGVISYIRLSKRLSASVRYIDNIYQSDSIGSPFIYGIMKPRIYVPFDMDNEYFSYVIAHERYHIKRKDYLVKIFAFTLLAVHWYNPLCYLAFYLMNKDMEMSCDENVLSNNIEIRKNYSYALLSFATDKSFPAPSPLCFGEGSVKSRIKNILKYKKPTMTVTIIAVVLCSLVLVSCAANPKIAPKNLTGSVDADISADYKAYAIGDCIGMPGGFSGILDGGGYAYISDRDIIVSRLTANEHFNELYKLGTSMTEEITKSDLEQHFVNGYIIPMNGEGYFEVPDFNNGQIIYYYDAVHSSTPSYSVYVFDDVPYMIEYAERYFKLTYDEAENEKLINKDYLASLATLSKNQRDYIDELFYSLENPEDPSIHASSNPADYIDYNEETYNTLVEGGIYTMQYIVDEFSKGGQTGLKGHIMRSVMDKILGGESLKLYAETGQEYFDAWAKHVVAIFSQSSAEDVEVMRYTLPYSYWYYTTIAS